MENDNTIEVHFLGGAETVTGSKFLIEAKNKKILVDCGLFQGLKKWRLLNWEDFPLDASSIDAVVLTHGHLDHCAYLPKLVAEGYNGRIFATPPTLDIAEIIIMDTAKIQEEEAERANKEKFTRHSPAKPLYDVKQAAKAVALFSPVIEGNWFQLLEGVEVKFNYNGHIIGSTFVELNVFGKRLVFSGDLGRVKDPLMRPPKYPEYADALFIESTYGDKLHLQDDVEDKLHEIIQSTYKKGGTLIIPSFAVERTQMLMYLLWQMKFKGRLPDIPLIMDSPMASNVLKVFHVHHEWHKLSVAECSEMCKIFKITRNFKETWDIIDNPLPKIVIAGSGMVTGGRVLSYLKHYLSRPETTVLIAGYQGEGTRGRALLEGAEEIKIEGKYIPVNATISNLQVLSAHADQTELLRWMEHLKNNPDKVFLIHGEPHAADALRVKIRDTFGWQAIVPLLYSSYKL